MDLPVVIPAKQRQHEVPHWVHTSTVVQLHLPKLQRSGLPVPLAANSHCLEQLPEPMDTPALSYLSSLSHASLVLVGMLQEFLLDTCSPPTQCGG